ncbi:MAG: branched-chain amino acid ABC transporter permease [Minisyncoccia bacterium]|jgi:branched-chain amino acid transport system permease protein
MPYLIHILILFCIYAILALGLNLVVGYTGLVSIMHAAFFGVGAYATAILTVDYHANFFLSVFVGMVVAGALAYLTGRILRGLSWDYYVLGTVGVNLILFGIFTNWGSLTRGPLGIPGIPRPVLFGIHFATNGQFLFLCFLVLVAVYFLCRFIVRSSFGRVLKAIRGDEKAIAIFGYHTLHYKLAVFSIAAIFAAVAGSLFASYLTFIAPSSFDVMASAFIFSIVILGGAANLNGSLVGALVLTILPEALRFIGFSEDIAAQMRQLVYGLLLVLLMLYRPQGFIGEYKLG